MDELIEIYLEQVADAVGYDISETKDRNYIASLVKSGLASMKNSGVSDEVLKSNGLVLTTLIIFVTDNMNMNAGQFTTSQMYITNVAQLRMVKE